MASLKETQYESAQRIYTSRASAYESSWHPSYTSRFMSLLSIASGQSVLLLACGTGLEAEIAAPLVGPAGLIIGVDATKDMLDVAREKQKRGSLLEERLWLYQHDVTDLRGCEGTDGKAFDWIVCSNAFVLFDNPAGVVEHWKRRLKPGGRMVIDITHEYNLRQGLILERVARRLGIRFPSNRSWIESQDSFQDILEHHGLEVERVEILEKEVGKGSEFYDVSQAREQFDYIALSPLTKMFASDELREKAFPLFKEAWEAAAVKGKVEVSDTLYVYVARKPED